MSRGPYTYGRDDNPTWTHLERAIGELEAPGQEDVDTLVFASGMAAISAVLFSQLKAGDVVVLPSDGYQVLPLVREQLEAYGIEVRTAPTGGDAQLDVLDGARLLWIETPSNPGLDVCDVRRLAEAAHARGALVAVDNTLATPLGQRPLELGADFSVASGTKQLTGHGDILLGYVTCRDAELAAGGTALAQDRRRDPRPDGGLARASLARHAPAAGRPAVRQRAGARRGPARPRRDRPGLRYPGLPDDPSHKIAARQMRRFGCVVSFVLPDRARAERFLEALRLVDDATSFGGVRSTAERRADGAATPCRRASSASPSAPRIRTTWWPMCCARWTRRPSRASRGPFRARRDLGPMTDTHNGRSEPPPSWLGPSPVPAREEPREQG